MQSACPTSFFQPPTMPSPGPLQAYLAQQAMQQAMQQQQAVQQQAMQQASFLAQQQAYQQQMPPMPSTAPSAADPPDPSGATPKHPAPKCKAPKGPAQTPPGTATHEIQRKAKAHVHDKAASRRDDNRYTKAMEQFEAERERANALEREKVELVKSHTQKLQQVHDKYSKKIEACGLWVIKAGMQMTLAFRCWLLLWFFGHQG